MEERLKQLLIIGGMFQPFLLGFEYIDVFFDVFGIKSVNMTVVSWSVWVLYVTFLLFAFMSFIFPMKKFNKTLSDKYSKSYLFLVCIGWVPYVSVPLNFLVSYFDEGLPEKWFDFVMSYMSFYEFCINCSFVLAAIVIIRRAYNEYRTKNAKTRYKNTY